jgi:hypothetical protein
LIRLTGIRIGADGVTLANQGEDAHIHRIHVD